MSSIPLPALAVRPPEQQAAPLEQYGKLLQLKALLNQQQLQPIQQQVAQEELKQHQLANKQAEYEFNATQALNKSYEGAVKLGADGIPQIDATAVSKSLSDANFGSAIPGVLENINKFNKGRLDVQNATADLQQKSTDLLGAAALAVQHANYDPRLAHTLLDTFPASPQVNAIRAKIDDPQGLKQMIDSMVAQSGKATESAKNVQQTREASASAQKNEKVLAGMNPQGMTAAEQAAAQHQAGELAVSRGRLAEERRHNQASEGSLTPEALTMAAQQYAQTGVMPALGRTAGMRTQIMNEAARVYPKIDIASNAAAYAANKQSLESLQKNFDQVTAFENTAGKNLDQFLSTAKKVVDFGGPLVNRPLRSVSGQLGSEQQAAFDAARQTAVTEIAKVLNSSNATGVLSDSARGEVQQLIGPNASLKQIYAAAQILRTDMKNRHDAYQEQIGDIQKRIGGGKTEETKPAPSGGGGPPAGATMKVPGSDGKLHWSDGKKDLGVVAP